MLERLVALAAAAGALTLGGGILEFTQGLTNSAGSIEGTGELTDIASEYGLTHLEPICEGDPPLPDWAAK